MTVLSIGLGQQYTSIASAVAAARDGDVLQIQAGTYINDFATIDTRITLQGVGGMAILKATVAPPNGKAILVTNTDVTLDHLELTGAAVADGNGAGIRFQGGSLLITNSYIHDNQEGILSGEVPGGRVTIRDSEIAHNGAGDGYTHNVYIGRIDSLTIEGSSIHDAVVGHQVKSRADATTITNSVIDDGAGNGSYSVDLPEGGRVVLRDTVLHQGAASSNPAIVHFGGEGPAHPGSSLLMDGVTVINDLASPSAAVLLNQTDVVASIAKLSLSGAATARVAEGLAQIIDGVATGGAPSEPPGPAMPQAPPEAAPPPTEALPDPAVLPEGVPITVVPPEPAPAPAILPDPLPPAVMLPEPVPVTAGPPAAPAEPSPPATVPDSFHFQDMPDAAPIADPGLALPAEEPVVFDGRAYEELKAMLMATGDPGLQDLYATRLGEMAAANAKDWSW